MSDLIPYGRQLIGEDDIEAVAAVLRSDYLTQGPAVEAFEKGLAEYAGATYAVVFSSGTAALHGAYHAAGIGAGHEVITSPITFVATANAALYLGARPVFADVEADTGNLDAATVEAAITPNTRAIVPVHYAGHPCDMGRIAAIACERGIAVIEDACHAIGAGYKVQGARDKAQGEAEQRETRGPDPVTRNPEPVTPERTDGWFSVGACAHSDMTVFSFHPVKQMTTGEGGAVLTNNPVYRENLLQFRAHGITRDHFTREPDGDWYYEMQFLGCNYRMTDIHAALGLSQLAKLDFYIRRRCEIASTYNAAFGGNPWFELPVERPYARSSRHLYPLRLKDGVWQRKKELFARLRAAGVGTQVHYIPVYRQPYYDRLGYPAGLCPVAEDFYRRVLSIPLYPGLGNDDVQKVIGRLQEALRSA